MLSELRNMLQVSRAVGRGDDGKVEALCNSALAHDADDTFSLGILANMYWRSEKYEQALYFALRILESAPDDFEALRIVAHAYAESGDNESTYRYAERLCIAKPLTSEPLISPTVQGFNALTGLFAWIPKVRVLRARLVSGKDREERSNADWISWAKDYVRWYESQSETA